MSVEVIVGSGVSVRGLSRRALVQLKAECEMRNPQFDTLTRLNKWTGDTPERIVTWKDLPNEWTRVPRGAERLVLDLVAKSGRRTYWDDRTSLPMIGAPGASSRWLDMYDYQQDAATELIEHSIGMLVAPPGSGKTNILLTVAHQLKTPTLVVVHTRELLKQTVERCRDWLGVEPNVIGGGYSTKVAVDGCEQPITVATIQTLTRWSREALAELGQTHGAVMVDEVHHAPARSWTRVIDRLPCRHKYGFTATPYRKDGLDRLIELAVGPVRATIDQDATVEAGRTVRPVVQPVWTGRNYHFRDASDWGRVLTKIARDDERNEMIAVIARQALLTHRFERVLVLTDRVEHVGTLAAPLRQNGLGLVAYLTGELSRSARESEMARVRNGTPVTVATSQLLGEGVDVPGWDALVLACPMAKGPRVVQAVGRVTRAAEGKDRPPVVYDLVDDATPTLLNAWRGRKSLYKKNGWEVRD